MNYQRTVPITNLSPARDFSNRAARSHLNDLDEGAELHDDSFPGEQPTLDERLRIHEYERQRLGQELHDSTGQLVVVLLLSLARLRAIEEDFGQGTRIDDIQEIVHQIDKEIRSLAFLHYPAQLDDDCLSSSIEKLARGFGRRTGMRTGFKCKGDAPEVDNTISATLLRITQEALVNVHRHARATAVMVELINRPDQIELRISDNGTGLPDAQILSDTSGIGVLGMRHRVETCGGQFEMRRLDPGTLVRALIPIAT